MKGTDIIKCILFFATGFLASAIDSLLAISRQGTPLTWSLLFQPVTFMCAIKGGIAVILAYLIQSPIARNMQTVVPMMSMKSAVEEVGE